MKGNSYTFFVLLFVLFFQQALTAQTPCAACTNVPAPYAECTPPTSGYDMVVTVTGNQTWTSLLSGISHEDMNRRIRIVGTGTLRVVNGNLKMSTANSLIVVDGPELIVNNGNLIFESGSVGIFRNVRLRTFGNIQQSAGSTLCITNSEVECGEESANGRFNTTGNQYSAADFQNDKGRRYLNTVCMNVTHDYQLQSGGGEDILINVCAEIGDKGGTHARTGILDGNDSGNFQNSSDMRIYNSKFWVIENVQNQSSGRMLTCDVSFRTTNGNFQNNGELPGCGLCVWVDNQHLMQNDGNWTATFEKRRATTQGTYPNLPANSSTTDIASCFVSCCDGGNPFGSIGNFVWNDLNRNGIQDVGEAGVPNVTVQLKNCSNVILTTTTTNANGLYNFPNLQPGCYRVGVVLPTGFQATLANVGTNDAVDSDIIPATAMTGDIDLDISENDPTNDVGIFQALGSIGDFTFCDNNSNGIFDNGDTPQSGVQVTLCNAVNVVIATTTTDAQGKYLFPNLAAATYIVKFPTTITGGKTITTPNPITVPLGAGQNFLNADGGYKPPVVLGSIGDFTFCDNNSNGIFDNGDTPQSGVQVTLCNAANVVIATATTDAQGKYLFPNLAAATYIVKFPTTITGGKTITTSNPITVPLAAGQNFLDADGGYKPLVQTCPDGSPKKTPGTACNDNNPNTTNDVIQADGCTCKGSSTLLGKIGDQVYCDNNNNGVFDAGDVGIANVTVTLCNASNVIIGTTTTNVSGIYAFNNLAAATYIVKFPTTADNKPLSTPNNLLINLGAGQTILTADAGYFKPTGGSCVRIVTDCKAGTNDRIGLAFKDFFTDGSTATWNFEPGTTFTENADGTADLVGVISHYANPTTRKFNINVHFIGKTFIAPPGSPVLMNTPGIPTTGWYYYNWGAATLTGVVGTHTAGAKLTLAKRDKSFQIGLGAADQLTETTQFGGTGWFSWTIVSQPTNGWLKINAFPAFPAIEQGDICFRLGTCTPIQAVSKNEVLTIEAVAELSRARIEFINNTGSKNDFFTIEKANNTTGLFEKIEIVNNKSLTNSPEHYSVYDEAPVEGDNTYRLRVTYLDGTSKLTAPKTLTFKDMDGVRLFPNPADDILSLDLSKYKGQSVNIYMYNQFGQKILSRSIEKVGSEIINLDISQQQSGNYMLRVTAKDKKDVVKQIYITK